MKKNKMMRTASGLLVATLLTTSVISGTFAKYITTDSAQDTARVAKFGVVATVSGDLFGSAYQSSDGQSISWSNANNGTVNGGAANSKVVAPGTSNTKGLTLSVTGTPEVSTKVHFDDMEVSGNKDHAYSDIVLKNGSYGVMVPYLGTITEENVTKYYVKDAAGTYTKANIANVAGPLYDLHDTTAAMTNDYAPVKWSLVSTSTPNENVNKGTQAEITNALTTIFNEKTFKPNESNDLNAKVTWEWDYGTGWDESSTGENLENTTDNDRMDTILGDMIAVQLGATGYDVVKGNSAGGFDTIKYVELDIEDESANKAIYAYTGATAPTVSSEDSICACLTVSFNGRLTVEQVN